MNARGIALGRLFGTDIVATPSFFLLLAYYFLVGSSNPGGAAAWCIAVIVSLLVHEFGHVFAVRWLLGGPSLVVLWALGGLCLHPPTPHRGRQVVISLMGPAFGLVLGGGAWLVAKALPGPHPLVAAFLFFMVWINLIWALANLLPIWPLDGGQALLAALAGPLGPARARALVRRISIAAAAAAAVVAFQLRYPLAGVIAIMLAADNLLGKSSLKP